MNKLNYIEDLQQEIQPYHTFQKHGVNYVFATHTGSFSEIGNEMLTFLEGIKAHGIYGAYLNLSNELGLTSAIKLFEQLCHIGVISNDKSKRYPEGIKIPVTAIQLHVSHRCNLACTYCYANQGDYGGPSVHMSWEVAKQAVDWLMECSLDAPKVRISFFGGEPLMNLDVIKKVVPYARATAKAHKKQVHFGMTTNGLLLNKENRAYLNKENIRFMVSTDGTQEIHDKNRPTKGGKGSYNVIKSNIIAQAEEAGAPVSVRATHCSSDDEIRDVYTELNSLPIASGFVAHMGNPSDSYFSEMSKKNEQILEEEISFLERTGSLRFSPFSKISYQLDTQDFTNYPCGGGRNFLAITPDGGVYFCHRFALKEDFKLGTIQNDFDSIQHMFVPSVDQRPVCRNCWARYVCGGQCFQELAERHKGDYITPDLEYCSYFKTLVEQAIVLTACAYNEGAKISKIPESMEV